MLELDELVLWSGRFKVAPEQIKKDHLISHLLAGIAGTDVGERVVFFGGTTLASVRTSWAHLLRWSPDHGV